MNKFYGKEEGGYLESGNWNVAEPFAMRKIMKPLDEFENYRVIAEFGSMELSEEFFITPEIRAEARVKALKRMQSCLLRVIGNSLFAVNKKTDKDELRTAKKLIEEKINPLINICYDTNSRVNGKKNVFILFEKPFGVVFDLLTQIHDRICEPLNRNDLIFSTQDNETVEEFKERMIDRIVNQG
ncbi:MAG: hypothetical protein KKD94_05550 [Nanoarchaeota archaeon]|nr:hypothetical protein [Nanoarchaeota archaeon]MBU1988914.1 hypothetical protein [Nanoarchaeota archaeon]